MLAIMFCFGVGGFWAMKIAVAVANHIMGLPPAGH
jgi:hypothetical protein